MEPVSNRLSVMKKHTTRTLRHEEKLSPEDTMDVWTGQSVRLSSAVSAFSVLSILSIFPVFSQPISLDPNTVEPVNTAIQETTWKGQNALKVTGIDEKHQMLVLLPGTNVHNGEISADVAGLPASGSFEGARGFIGMVFRLERNETMEYECFYLRPTNGRAEDQLRRNHSTQYISEPSSPWYKLRHDHPGVYESYVDLVPGEWTHIRIALKGTRAELYVNNAFQPCLIVNDLKRGDVSGEIALWIGVGTEGYFKDVSVVQQESGR